MDDQTKDPKQASGGSEPLESNPEVEEFFRKLSEKAEMRRPKPSDEAIAAAIEVIQRLGAAEEPANMAETQDQSSSPRLVACSQCEYENQFDNQFCGMCGSPLASAEAVDRRASSNIHAGQHHYHHHYHHYFPAGQGQEFLAAGLVQSPPTPMTAGKEAVKLRTSLGAGVSRAEAAVRQLTQDWALACNNKQLDDLLSFYATDALVLRPNVPPIRGLPAIREFFFTAIDSGLGDIEMDTLRVYLLGDVAYEAGRCKMLVPMAVGKRREERGKYVILFAKQKTGEWKAVVDSWSSDLSLNVTAEPATAKVSAVVAPGAQKNRQG